MSTFSSGLLEKLTTNKKGIIRRRRRRRRRNERILKIKRRLQRTRIRKQSFPSLLRAANHHQLSSITAAGFRITRLARQKVTTVAAGVFFFIFGKSEEKGRERNDDSDDPPVRSITYSFDTRKQQLLEIILRPRDKAKTAAANKEKFYERRRRRQSIFETDERSEHHVHPSTAQR